MKPQSCFRHRTAVDTVGVETRSDTCSDVCARAGESNSRPLQHALPSDRLKTIIGLGEGGDRSKPLVG